MQTTIIDAFQFVRALVSVRRNEKNQFKKFLGCGFFIDHSGLFVTCTHVLNENLEGNEIHITVPYWENASIRLDEVARHPKYDFALLRCSIKPEYVLPLYAEPLNPGEDVQTFGYYNPRSFHDELAVEFRTYKGYIASLPTNRYIPEAAPTYIALSFPAVSGFSGAPLLRANTNAGGACGMVFMNAESSITVAHKTYVERESTESGVTTVIEKIDKVYETGIAHCITDIVNWIEKDLGLKLERPK